MKDKNKEPSSALEAAALADQLKGLISGRAPVSSLIKAINIFKPTKKAKGGEVKKYKNGGSVKKKNKMITTKGFGASRKT